MLGVPMRAWSILGNSQRLDGGAMFGNAPRVLWQQWITPDDENRIPLACRALLIHSVSLNKTIVLSITYAITLGVLLGYLQSVLTSSRTAEVGDVLSNLAGAVIGTE